MELWAWLLQWFTVTELVASVLGIISVSLLVRQNIWCWPIGIVMVTMYVYIFWDARLYSDMGLQVYYIGMQAWGWYHWLHGDKADGTLEVSRLRPRTNALWIAVLVASTGALGFTMSSLTNADVPYWDAATTVMSLLAQYLQTMKWIEAWVLWILVDILATGIYIYKGLFATAVLYAVFLGLAVWGLIDWSRVYARAEAEPA